jgi:hypothetical protein
VKDEKAPHRIRSKGRRKLSKAMLATFPQEVIEMFARLPKGFRKSDVNNYLGDRISRSMEWKYLHKMEKHGLIRHTTKKYYRKIYDSVSDWIEKEIIPRIRRTEARSN